MPDSRTPEEQATERYPDNIVTELGSTSSDGQLGARIGFAACLTERAIPAEEEVERLKGLIELKFNEGFVAASRQHWEELSLMRSTVKIMFDAVKAADKDMDCDDWGEVDMNGEGATKPYSHDIVAMPEGCPACKVREALSLAKERHPFLNEKQDEQRG